MVRNDFLYALKVFTEDCVKDFILPCRVQTEDEEQKFRCPEVFLQRLPDSKAAKKKVPYIIHQLTTGVDRQLTGQQQESTVLVRHVFAVYDENEQEGALNLIELIDRFRIGLLKNPILANRYVLDNTAKMETFIYPDDTAPYYAGELATEWHMPIIRREDAQFWVREPLPMTELPKTDMWEMVTAVSKPKNP